MKDPSDEAGASGNGLLFADVKAYFNDWFRKIFADNQVGEERIMGQVEVVVKEVKKGREKLKEELKVEM